VRLYLRRAGLVALILLPVPILLFVFQPGIALGAMGLVLGVIGTTLSLIILFGALFLWARSKW